MIRTTLILGCCLSIWTAHATPSPCMRKSGIIKCQAGEIDHLNSHGRVILQDTHVQNTCSVHGELNATHAQMGTLKLSGYAHLTDCIIEKSAIISGAANIHHSNIEGPLKLSGDQVHITESTLHSLTLNSAQTAPVVHLQGTTVVHNDVVFTEKPGTIHLSADAKIVGKIINGTAIPTS